MSFVFFTKKKDTIIYKLLYNNYGITITLKNLMHHQNSQYTSISPKHTFTPHEKEVLFSFSQKLHVSYPSKLGLTFPYLMHDYSEV